MSVGGWGHAAPLCKLCTVYEAACLMHDMNANDWGVLGKFEQAKLEHRE